MNALFIWLPALLCLAAAPEILRAHATLHCLVMDESGHPVDGAEVQVLDAYSSSAYASIMDSTRATVFTRLGRCSLAIYPWNHKVRLLISKYGFFPTEIDIPVVPGLSRISVIELHTARAGTGEKSPAGPKPPDSMEEERKMRIIPVSTISGTPGDALPASVSGIPGPGGYRSPSS